MQRSVHITLKLSNYVLVWVCGLRAEAEITIESSPFRLIKAADRQIERSAVVVNYKTKL